MGDNYSGVLPLANPDDFDDDPRLKGLKLQIGDDGRGQLAGATPEPAHASLSGPAPSYGVHPADRVGMMGTSAAQAHPRPTRKPTDQELMAKAMQMLDNSHAETQAVLGQGPSTGPRNDAGGQVPAWLRDYMNKDTDL